ncbi:MAG TPA: hypothetical protein VF188_06300 [Longimicrobiales bacterium]
MLLAATAIATGTAARGQEPHRIRLRPPDWVAGVEFTKITSVRELSDGILVGDALEDRLVFLDWHSGAATEIGRVGPGPGEYRGVGRLYPLPADSTLFVDSYSWRWNLLAGPLIVSTIGENRVLNRLLGRHLSGLDARGRVVGRGRLRRSDVRARRGAPDSVPLLMGQRASEHLDTIAQLDALDRSGATRLPARDGLLPALIGNNPLASQDEALLFLDGWVAIARTEPYRVDWRSPDGRRMQGPALPFDRIEVDRREKCAAIERLFRGRRRCEPSILPGWPETVPPFLPDPRVPVLFAAPDGAVVITRAPTADSRGHRYDVVDRKGRLVGVIQLPAEVRLIGFGPHSVYTVLTDSLDLQTLRRHPWP